MNGCIMTQPPGGQREEAYDWTRICHRPTAEWWVATHSPESAEPETGHVHTTRPRPPPRARHMKKRRNADGDLIEFLASIASFKTHTRTSTRTIVEPPVDTNRRPVTRRLL